MQIRTIGLDIAMNVFQVHAADATGAAILSKRLLRSQVLEFFAGLLAHRAAERRKIS